MLYGADRFDPLLIVGQIIVIQCLSYISLSVILEILLASYALPSLSFSTLSACYIFDYRYINAKTSLGWTLIVSNLANAVFGAFYLMYLIGRAKKCLDFASTFYILHLVMCWSVSGFPRSLSWWATSLLGLLTMTLLGEWLCIRREMADIPITSLRDRGRNRVNAPPLTVPGSNPAVLPPTSSLGKATNILSTLSNKVTGAGNRGGAAGPNGTDPGEHRIIQVGESISDAASGRSAQFGAFSADASHPSLEIELPVSRMSTSNLTPTQPGHVTLLRGPSSTIHVAVGLQQRDRPADSG